MLLNYRQLSSALESDISLSRKCYTVLCMEAVLPQVVQTRKPCILSQKLLKAEGKEFQRIALELQTAITEHIECIRARLAQYPLAEERRSPK